MDKKIKNKYWIILIVFPLILKLILAYIFPLYIGDARFFTKWADIIFSGKDIYSISDKGLIYGPLFYVMIVTTKIITMKTGMPFYFTFKLFPIFAETLMTITLFLVLNKKYNIKKSFYWSLIFSLNPATLTLSVVEAQFDAIPMLFMLLSYSFFISDNKKIRNILPAVCLGIGASFKYYPLLLLPVLFFKYEKIKEKISFAIITIATFFIIYVPLMISGDFFTALGLSLGYTPRFNWGIAKFFLLLKKFSIFIPLLVSIENFLISYGKLFLFFALIITLLIYSKTKNLERSYEMTFYCIYTFSFFIHPHYLMWIIPFLFLRINSKAIIYLILLTTHNYFLHIIKKIADSFYIPVSTYDNLFSMVSFVFGVLLWIYCTYMYFKYIKADIKNIKFSKILSPRYWLG